MLYSGEKLREISFPLGGIGTGCIGLTGDGSLTDWEIFNRPNKGSRNGYTFLAIRAEKADGTVVCKVLHGDLQKELTGRYGKRDFAGFGYGGEKVSMCGFPHFRDLEFDGTFPVAKLTMRDPDFPGTVELTAHNPFIPLDAFDSSIPAAFFRVRVLGGSEAVRCTLVFCAQNPYAVSENTAVGLAGGRGVYMRCADKEPEEVGYGDMTLLTDDQEGFVQPYWYRGGWQDGIATFWNEFERGTFLERTYPQAGRNDNCTVGTRFDLEAGGEHTARFILAWNSPVQVNYWDPDRDENGRDRTWKNYYATVFADSRASAAYAMENEDELYRRTCAFRDALAGSTLDPAVLDAASANLAVLKSPTVLRLEDGSFYGWEGVHETAGSCEGTCTHVWSYAYALCFLFPELERSIRENELGNSVHPDGYMRFRMLLPKGRTETTRYDRNDVHACVDGQMATVFKVYREWKVCGDTEWLRRMWPQVKSILGYAWSKDNPDRWDADHDGLLEGCQHHTLDMELFGPSSWLEGMYLAALRAAARMAAELGDREAEREYRTLFESGYRLTKEQLFNGEYFIQKVDLGDRTLAERYGETGYWNEEAGQLKYQIANGSSIDQMLGQWHAALCGLGDIFDPEQRRVALESMLRNNFKPSMRGFANPWRVFSLNDESGTVICDYPAGAEKPVIPVPYCEETMHGFEYAFAGLLVSEGRTDDAVRVVRAVRDRYDGAKRNPWNEIECGNNYARSMASFALLPLFSGLEYDMTRGMLGFDPKLPGDFRCLFSLAPAWGTLEREGNTVRIRVAEGVLPLKKLRIPFADGVREVLADGKPVPFRWNNGAVETDAMITDRLECRI